MRMGPSALLTRLKSLAMRCSPCLRLDRQSCSAFPHPRRSMACMRFSLSLSPPSCARPCTPRRPAFARGRGSREPGAVPPETIVGVGIAFATTSCQKGPHSVGAGHLIADRSLLGQMCQCSAGATAHDISADALCVQAQEEGVAAHPDPSAWQRDCWSMRARLDIAPRLHERSIALARGESTTVSWRLVMRGRHRTHGSRKLARHLLAVRNVLKDLCTMLLPRYIW